MQRYSRTFLLVAAMSALGGAVCSAQTATVPELITDRPDFTESSEVVGDRAVQIESGLTIEQAEPALHQVTAPQVLVRYGLGRRVELRVASDGYVSQTVRTPEGHVRTGGRSDAEIGAKVKFLDAPRAGVDMAVIGSLSLPLASAGFGTTRYDPGIKLTAARDLPNGFGVSANVNAVAVTGAAGREWTREASVSVGHALAGPFGAYWEGFGTLTGGGCDCTLNTGATMAIGANAQIDMEVGHGVSGAAHGWFVGVGFAVRRAGR